MLTAHPNISISSEGAHIYYIARNYSTCTDSRDVADAMRALHREVRPRLEKVRFLSIPTDDDLLEWVARHGTGLRSLVTFYGTWEARVLGKEQLAWWGDNAPYHVHHIPFFTALLPGIKFLVMIRDPRDTCASGKQNLTWGAGATDFQFRITQWQESLLHGMLAAASLGPTRVKYVRYEELVSRPEEVLREIAGFLGVEYADSMLSYHQSTAAAAIAALDHHRNVVKPVFGTSIGRFRERLTREEIEMIEEKLFTPMCELGYLAYDEYRRVLEKKTGIQVAAQ